MKGERHPTCGPESNPGSSGEGQCGSMMVSCTRDGRFQPFYCNNNNFITELYGFIENI